MRKTTLLFLLTLILPLFAAVECVPGFEETAAIQVVDARVRPIANASVQITYQLDKTTGKGYTTTAPKLTAADGTVTFVFRNQEIIKERVDCEYTIIASYDNKKVEQKVTVGKHAQTITVQMNAYLLSIQAIDQDGNALTGAELIVRDIRKKAGGDGKVGMILGNGSANVTLRYGDGSVSRLIQISNDTDYSFQVGVYWLGIYVVDDANMPLDALMNISGKILYTNVDGYAEVKKLLTARPEVKITYRGVEKTLDTDLAVQDTYYAVYDLHAPKISNLGARNDDGSIVLDMYVVDEGVRASGLAPDGIKVSYSFGGTDYSAPVYVKARHKYEALLSGIEKEGVVEIAISARDNEGNIRSVKGYFSVMHESNKTEGGNETPNGRENGNETGRTDEAPGVGGSGFSMEPLHILGVGIAIIIGLIVVSYIREKFSSS